MNIKCGIIGLPNVGKSTIFNLLTKSNILTNIYPFTTIKPNISILYNIDDNVKKIGNMMNINKINYSHITIFDIAGLIKGASQGIGLGNKFLSDIKNVDILIHVVRNFDNNIIHINNKIDILHDILTINTELLFSDLYIINKEIEITKKNQKKQINNIQSNNNKLIFLQKIKNYLEEENMLYTLNFNNEEKKIIQSLHLLTYKPVLYIINTENIENNNEKIIKIMNKIDNNPLIFMCANNKNINVKKILNNIFNHIYQKLNLHNFITIKKQEITSWIIKKDMTAYEASKIIHSDIQKGFIRAEIIKYKDFIQYENYKQLKKNGHIKIQGKNYLIQNNDIINFLFNV